MLGGWVPTPWDPMVPGQLDRFVEHRRVNRAAEKQTAKRADRSKVIMLFACRRRMGIDDYPAADAWELNNHIPRHSAGVSHHVVDADAPRLEVAKQGRAASTLRNGEQRDEGGQRIGAGQCRADVHSFTAEPAEAASCRRPFRPDKLCNFAVERKAVVQNRRRRQNSDAKLIQRYHECDLLRESIRYGPQFSFHKAGQSGIEFPGKSRSTRAPLGGPAGCLL